jgi:hypothetical protein
VAQNPTHQANHLPDTQVSQVSSDLIDTAAVARVVVDQTKRFHNGLLAGRQAVARAENKPGKAVDNLHFTGNRRLLCVTQGLIHEISMNQPLIKK